MATYISPTSLCARKSMRCNNETQYMTELLTKEMSATLDTQRTGGHPPQLGKLSYFAK